MKTKLSLKILSLKQSQIDLSKILAKKTHNGNKSNSKTNFRLKSKLRFLETFLVAISPKSQKFKSSQKRRKRKLSKFQVSSIVNQSIIKALSQQLVFAHRSKSMAKNTESLGSNLHGDFDVKILCWKFLFPLQTDSHLFCLWGLQSHQYTRFAS